MTDATRQPLLQDGNLILHGSDFDESKTVTDLPADPTPVEKMKLKSLLNDSPTSANMELPPPVQRKLFAEVSCFFPKVPIFNPFLYLSSCDIDPDLEVPTFFSNPKDLAHLLCLMPPQINDTETENALKEILEDDDEVLEIMKPNQFTPRKKRAKKMKEPLPDDFLRRSKRQANRSGGFKGKSAVEILSPKPLAMIPASPPPLTAPAPHLNKDIVEGIATGFLQIHPRDVSDALIKLEANEDED